jgi:proline iminopeptidase
MKFNLTFLAIAFITLCLLSGCKKEYRINEAGNLVPKTVDQDASLPAISVNGTKLHCETFGNPADPILIFLHGGPGGDYRNALSVKQLANNGYHVVFYDQRGSGLSRRHDQGRYSIQLMLDDLTAVITNFQKSPNQKVYLFGHSWGAMVAAAYVNSYPTKIAGVIFAEPGGFSKKLLDEYAEGSRKLSLFSETTNDLLYTDQFITGRENDHEILDYKFALSTSFSYAEGNDEGIEGPSPFWRGGAAALNSFVKIAEDDGFDFTPNLNKYQPKVLFLYGELNKSYGLAFAQKEAKFFTKADIVKIAGTGHEMIYFKWDNVYPHIFTYLNSVK